MTAGRTRQGRRRLLHAQRLDVVLAVGVAGLVNAAMLVVAARLFTGGADASSLAAVHAELGARLGTGVAVAFALALLASGLAWPRSAHTPGRSSWPDSCAGTSR